MYDWTSIKNLASEQEFEDYRDLVMYCSVIEHTDDKDLCDVCGGDHVSVERRIRCTSVSCSAGSACPVIWKVHHCSASDARSVQVNEASHGRGALPCFGGHPPRITAAMKAFFESEDDGMIPPRSIEVRLQRHPTIREPPRGWPTIEQIVNALKRIRDEKGRRNTIAAIKEFVAKRVYTASSEHHPKAAFIFAPRLDSDGCPFVASGDDDDPFVLGVTALQLLDNVLQFSDGSRFVMFHADATFKLSDFAYPVITCGVTDGGRGYHLDECIQRWKTVSELTGFAEYFCKQWLAEPFWRWQIFHTPAGYAATNNPCEVYNASIKKFTQRRRFHMTRLLQKMCDLVETHKLSSPVTENYVPKPTADIVAAAKRMVASGRTVLRVSPGETRLLLKYTRRHGEEYETTDVNAFVGAFDKRIEISKKDAASKRRGVAVDAEKTKAALLYKQAVSWSLWRTHCRGMPDAGWTVDNGAAHCNCKYFAKFKVCAHLLIAQNRHDLSSLGKPRKILDRSRSQSDRNRGGVHAEPTSVEAIQQTASRLRLPDQFVQLSNSPYQEIQAFDHPVFSNASRQQARTVHITDGLERYQDPRQTPYIDDYDRQRQQDTWPHHSLLQRDTWHPATLREQQQYGEQRVQLWDSGQRPLSHKRQRTNPNLNSATEELVRETMHGTVSAIRPATERQDASLFERSAYAPSVQQPQLPAYELHENQHISQGSLTWDWQRLRPHRGRYRLASSALNFD